MYMASKWPLAEACMMTPTIPITADPIKAPLLPHFSAAGDARRAPKKHPAWRVETMFADKFACATGSRSFRPYVLGRRIH